MLKSTSSPLLLFQRKFMLYHQSFSHFLLFIITLCHRKIFTLRIMFVLYRFLCNFVHCKQFFLFNSQFFCSFYKYSRETKKEEKLFVYSCVIWCVRCVHIRFVVSIFECGEMNSLWIFFFVLLVGVVWNLCFQRWA